MSRATPTDKGDPLNDSIHVADSLDDGTIATSNMASEGGNSNNNASQLDQDVWELYGSTKNGSTDQQESIAQDQGSGDTQNVSDLEDRVFDSESFPNEEDGDEFLDDDFDESMFLLDEDIGQPLHPSITAYLSREPLHDRYLSERQRRMLLRGYPPCNGFSARPPAAEHAFASLAHRQTVARDKQLAGLTVCQLQSLRPLLAVWNGMLTDPEQLTNGDIVKAIQTSVALILHGVSATTNTRRRWILQDVNPQLIHTLKAPVVPLFGADITKRLQEADSVATTVRRMQARPNSARPNGQNRPAGNSTFDQRRGPNHRFNSSNRGNTNRGNTGSVNFNNRNNNARTNFSNSRVQPSASGSGQNA